MYSTSAKNIKESHDDVVQMRATYSNMPKFTMFDLIVPLRYLRVLYHKNNQLAKSGECFMEIYEVATECGEYYVGLMALLDACNSYRQCGIHEKAEFCLREAQSFFGTANKPLFELVLSKIRILRGLTHV